MKTIEDIIRELNLKCTALNTNSVTIEQTDENDEFKCNSHISDFYKGKIEGLSEAKKLLEEVKKLDEPQKPVVPQFIAELIKQGKKQCFTLYGTMECANLKLFTDSIHMEKCKAWLLDWHNQETFAQAWLFGYEVEKEPLYCVKIGKGYFSGFDDTKVTYVIDDAPGALAQRVKYETREEAEMDAIQIGGTVEEVRKDEQTGID